MIHNFDNLGANIILKFLKMEKIKKERFHKFDIRYWANQSTQMQNRSKIVVYAKQIYTPLVERTSEFRYKR